LQDLYVLPDKEFKITLEESIWQFSTIVVVVFAAAVADDDV